MKHFLNKINTFNFNANTYVYLVNILFFNFIGCGSGSDRRSMHISRWYPCTSLFFTKILDGYCFTPTSKYYHSIKLLLLDNFFYVYSKLNCIISIGEFKIDDSSLKYKFSIKKVVKVLLLKFSNGKITVNKLRL